MPLWKRTDFHISNEYPPCTCNTKFDILSPVQYFCPCLGAPRSSSGVSKSFKMPTAMPFEPMNQSTFAGDTSPWIMPQCLSRAWIASRDKKSDRSECEWCWRDAASKLTFESTAGCGQNSGQIRELSDWPHAWSQARSDIPRCFVCRLLRAIWVPHGIHISGWWVTAVVVWLEDLYDAQSDAERLWVKAITAALANDISFNL